MMELTVLGKYGPWPAVDGACSGYLVSTPGAKLLLDCGSGVLSRLQRALPILDLSAVVLSHLHADHMGDMLILRYALQLQKAGKMPVFMPDEPRDVFELVTSHGVFDVCAPEGEHKVGDCTLTFCAMDHPIPSYAVRVESAGKVLVYSGDTRYTPALADFAKGADVLLCDAGHLQRDKVDNLPHLTAHEAAEIAASAGAKKLICSHVDPLTDQNALRAEARGAFPAAIIAREGETHMV